MTRMRWEPPAADRPVVCRLTVGPDATRRLLDGVRSVREALDAPVQALRADRIVSPLHLEMAAWHAARARGDGRSRSDDPALEFLLYAAADRQIARALDALGHPGAPVPLLVAALGGGVTPERLASAVTERFDERAVPWPCGDDVDARLATAARAWWAERLGLARGPDGAGDAVLAEMATLSVARL